jgi:hypothetical protein
MASRFGRRTTSIAVGSMAVFLASCASPGGAQSKAAGSPEPSAATGTAEPYVPGLGEIMSLTQMRHLKLWFAGQAENWELASYETDELEEGFADVVRFHPTHKSSPEPLTRLVPEFTEGPIEALRSAIAQRDLAAFTAGFDSLTQGCNGCHRAADFSFNVVVQPTSNPYSNQSFRAP